MEHGAQETYDLYVATFRGEVVQPFDDCRYRSIEVAISLWVCVAPVFGEFIKWTSFVDRKYFGKDASEREDIAFWVSVLVVCTLR